MAVDITDFVDNLKREVNPPGTDLFPDATTADWEGRLLDAFWEARLLGLLATFSMDEDGVITPLSGTDDIGRDLVQLVIFLAGMTAIKGQLSNLKSMARYKAGPVEYETQQSAQLLRALFSELQDRLKIILARLSDLGQTTDYVFDGVLQRFDSWNWGDSWWIR